MSVPSSAHRCTWPWPKPLAMAWTRMSRGPTRSGTRSRDAQRVVEAVAAGRLAEGLADAERHVVAEDGQRRGRRLEQVGHAGPQRRVPVGGPLAVEVHRVAGRGEPHVEPPHDRVVDLACGTTGPRTRRAAARRAACGHAPSAGMSREPRAALTVRISVSPTWATARAWVTDLPVTGDGHVDVHHRRRPGVGEVLGGGPDHRPTGGRLEGRDRGAQPAAAEQEHVPGAEPGHHRQVPAVRVVGRLEPEELPGVHAAGNLGGGSAYLLLPCLTPPGRRRLLARRCLPERASARRSRSSRPRSPPSRPATSTPSRSSTPTAPGPGPRPPTSSQPFGGVPFGVKELDAGRGLARHRGVARLQGPHGHPHRHDDQPAGRAGRREPGRPDASPRSSAASTSASTASTASPTTRGSTGRPPAARRAAARRRSPAAS